MSKNENGTNKMKENAETKQNNEVADFFQLLQNNGMFVDCVSTIKEEMEEIEKKLR